MINDRLKLITADLAEYSIKQGYTLSEFILAVRLLDYGFKALATKEQDKLCIEK